MAGIDRKKVIIFHHETDKKYLERLRIHLTPLEKKGLVEVWDTASILPGAERYKETQQALSTAKVAILLINADFLASDFVENELPILLDMNKANGAVILSIITNYCTFQDTKLSEFQAVNNPSTPLSGLNKSKQENLWNKVSRDVKNATFPLDTKKEVGVAMNEDKEDSGAKRLFSSALTSRSNELGIPFSSPEGALKTTSRQIEENNTQPNAQVEENHRLATEERYSQSFPTIVPTKAIDNVPAMKVEGRPQEYFYTAEVPPLKGNISWALTFPEVPLAVSNVGMGPAFNVHCVLHGYEDIYEYQFISWNNGPIGADKDEIIHLRHPRHRELWLDRNDSVDGEHMLHYPSTGQSNPNRAQACLTMTYQDLSGNKFVSIFDYTPYHEWVCVAISTPSSPKIALDLKELNERKKQKNP